MSAFVIVVCSIIGLVVLGLIGHRMVLAWEAEEDARDPVRWIVIVEPSIFRVHETYVLGPFGKYEAERVQREETSAHPFSATWRREANCRVECAGRVLWPRTPEREAIQ